MRKNFEVKSVSMIRLLACACCCVSIFVIAGCSAAPAGSNPIGGNTNTENVAVKPSPAAPPVPAASPSGGGGDAIDTSKLDAEILKAEKALSNGARGGDEAGRQRLAEAYLARANALTKARQYRSALGDFRRTLKYDPDNADAREMSGQIIGIMQSMGREVPAEGKEPPPLPFIKETQGADNKSQPKSY